MRVYLLRIHARLGFLPSAKNGPFENYFFGLLNGLVLD